MKIGIISDVHDNLRSLSKLIKVLKEDENIDILIHCGDWVMPFTMRTYVSLGKPIRGVLGNGDPDIQKFLYQLQNLEALKGIDMQIKHRFFDLKYDDRRIGVIHGDDEDLNNTLIESQLYDVLCIGHTHVPSLTKVNNTVVINPGSLVGYMVEKGEVAITYGLYDTTTGVAEIKELESKKQVVVIQSNKTV
jgi:uncharacterized protein